MGFRVNWLSGCRRATIYWSVVADLLGTREGLSATAKFIHASGAFLKPPGEDATPADD
ncbi:hypothetical protein EXIGLDRAFT_783576 [Exidia glandulosa HHB12029]|uniref:Uncharacterized protein n=1 Tax=Exidia glandulosa HHB12029 TaxID=1314781 RepID=A0A166MZL1_EXIGL|nr:hypothetical protein EXIGLDRAFT_783576 [Exidia glandulosa HHB12029]